MASSNTPGQAFEAVIVARHRLRTLHLILALVASFSLSTGAPLPHFNAFNRGAGWGVILISVFGWAPYFISWFYSRSALEGNSRGVIAFTVGALLITLIGAGLYQNTFGFQENLAVPVVSAGVTLSLIGVAKVCSMVWAPLWK
jgi:hypothetical protein